MIPIWVPSPEKQVNGWCKFLSRFKSSPKADEDQNSSLKSVRQRERILSYLTFYSIYNITTKVHVVKAVVFTVVMYDVRIEPQRRLRLLNCDAAEDSRESLGWQGDCKETKPVNHKENQP